MDWWNASIPVDTAPEQDDLLLKCGCVGSVFIDSNGYRKIYVSASTICDSHDPEQSIYKLDPQTRGVPTYLLVDEGL